MIIRAYFKNEYGTFDGIIPGWSTAPSTFTCTLYPNGAARRQTSRSHGKVKDFEVRTHYVELVLLNILIVRLSTPTTAVAMKTFN